MRILIGLLSSVILAALSGTSKADITEKKGRIEVNWTTQRLSYFGESVSAGPNETTYREAEQRAWRDGFAYLETSLVEAKAIGIIDDSVQSEAWKQQAKKIAKSSTSVNTTYFGDGKVRVLLEANVDGSIINKKSSSKDASSADGLPSGVVFVVTGDAHPTPYLRVETANGKVVFNTAERTLDGKRFGGYWFRSSGKNQVSAVVGKNAIEIEAKARKDSIVVSEEVWDSKVKPLQSLMEAGKVAILIP